MIVVAEHSIKAVTTIEAKRNLEGDVTKVLYTLGRQLSTTGEGGWDATSPTYPGSILQRLSCPLASCMDIPVAADGTLLSSGQIEKEPLLLPTGDVATYRTVLEYFSERLQSVGQVVNLEVKEEPDRRLKVKITFPKAPGAPNQLGLRITVKDETVDSQKGDALLRRGTRARVTSPR